jgi:DNA-binding MarR family transcriptional regulator
MSNSFEPKQSAPTGRSPVRPPLRPGAGPRQAGRQNAAAAPRGEEPIRQGLLPELLGYQLRLAQVAVFRDFGRTVGPLGISPGRVGMLLLVEANPGIAQSRLAAAVNLDRSTMVPVLDALEATGWLERRPGPDRRTKGLWLTGSGKRFLARIKTRVREHEMRIAARLSEAERRELIRLLAALQDEA